MGQFNFKVFTFTHKTV